MEAVPRRQRLFTLLFQNYRELRRKARIPGIMAERIRDHMVFCVSGTPNIKQTHPLARTAETLARFSGSGALDIIPQCRCFRFYAVDRSEEHTSELQSLMRISYAVFCLKKKNKYNYTYINNDYR